jgi:hypothetical protein
VIELTQLCGSLALETVHELHKGIAGQGSLLSLSHLRRCHHLHCLGDLRSASY